MKLDNLKINILGDSITAGKCATRDEDGYFRIWSSELTISNNLSKRNTRILFLYL